SVMVRVVFTQNLQRHLPCPTTAVEGRTVREVLDAVFAQNQSAKGYVLDDQGSLRKHMIIFVNGEEIHDRIRLADVVPDGGEVYGMQALSGGEAPRPGGPSGKTF